MIYKNMHRANARATFLKGSLGRTAEHAPRTPFLLVKTRIRWTTADRSDRTLGRRGLARLSASAAKELRQWALDLEVIFPKPNFLVGEMKIRLCWLIITIKCDMRKYARRRGESTILATSHADTPLAMSSGLLFLQVNGKLCLITQNQHL